KKMSEGKNVLFINPVHLTKGNYTLTFERFITLNRSFKFLLSGGEKENYVSAAFEENYYPFKNSSVNYLVGISLMGYESPIATGVPIARPMNQFFESTKDQYYSAMQIVNGA